MEKELKKETISRHVVKVGISIGDVNGISPEVIMKALKDSRILMDCTPIIYASPKAFSFHKKLLQFNDFNYTSCKNAEEAKPKKVNIVNIWENELKFDLGKATTEGGQ